MKTKLFFAAFWLIFSFAHSQILYEKGFYIDNSGKRVDCFIRNADWKSNPTKFRYKRTQDGAVETADITSVQAFEIFPAIRYERHPVKIDRRSYLASRLSQDRNPVFSEESLFLRLLVDGKAKLYKFEDGNLRRFFYSVDDKSPTQLVYTRYKSPANKILENYLYKSQLSEEVSNEATSSTLIDQTSYKQEDLVSYFVIFNGQPAVDYVSDENQKKRKLFHINLRPGIEVSSMKVKYYLENVPDTDFGSNLAIRFGPELEMLMPFNKNKWALLLEPYYRSYSAENNNDTHVKYQSIATTLGIRHYMYLSEASKLYLNANFGFEIPLQSDFRVATSVTRRNLEVDGTLLDNNWSAGMGYKVDNTWGIEVRYLFKQDLLRAYEFWSADWSGFSLITSYTLF